MLKDYIDKVSGEKLYEIFLHLKSWGIKGGIAVTDQALFSGSNFIINVLLARWFSSELYGIFSIVFSIYLFASSFHNALILEPMTILGPANYSENIHAFVVTQIKIHFPFTAAMGLFLVIAGYLFPQASGFRDVLVSAGLSLPFLLLLWLVRRAFYVMQKPQRAMLSSFLYSMFLTIGLLLSHPIQIVMVFPLLGAASFFGSVFVLLLEKIWDDKNRTFFNLREQLSIQWNFGKPLFIAAFFYTAGSRFQIFATGSLVGIDAAGVWRALQNFALPMMQGVTAISVLILPVLSVEFGRRNFHAMRYKGYRFMLIMVLLATIYEIVLVFFHKQVEYFLYGGKFAEYSWLIPVVGLIGILMALEVGFAVIVRSLQKPIYHAVYGVVNLVSSLIFVPALIFYWGITGAIFSQLVVGFFVLGGTFVLYRRYFPAEEPLN